MLILKFPTGGEAMAIYSDAKKKMDLSTCKELPHTRPRTSCRSIRAESFTTLFVCG